MFEDEVKAAHAALGEATRQCTEARAKRDEARRKYEAAQREFVRLRYSRVSQTDLDTAQAGIRHCFEQWRAADRAVLEADIAERVARERLERVRQAAREAEADAAMLALSDDNRAEHARRVVARWLGDGLLRSIGDKDPEAAARRLLSASRVPEAWQVREDLRAFARATAALVAQVRLERASK